MDFDKLTPEYFEKQVNRFVESGKKLVLRENPEGNIIPGSSDLVIGSGRRMAMAVMFLDITSFSSIPSELQQEQKNILNALSLFFTELVRIAEDYGGCVEKNTGDGMMVYFEDTVNKNAVNGSQRAIACALTMKYANEKLMTPIITALSIKPFSFRVGIDYGYVTIARLGAPKRFNSIVAIGTTANIASKMLSFAEPDEIVIGELARRELPTYWQEKWTERIPSQSGWIYINSKTPYNFYRYTGRWIPPS